MSFVNKSVAATPPPPPPVVREGGSILNPEELERFKNLLVFAQAAIDGYFVGKHRSHDYGSNAEFAEHMQYQQGQPVDHLDWKVYGRTKKLMLRRYEEETDMVAYLLVDTSGSMRYKGVGQEPKYLQAAKLAAALSYLMIKQGDKVSLSLFGGKIRKLIPPGGTKRHLFELIDTLEGASTEVVGQTDLPAALSQAAGAFRKKGRLVILSDLYGDPDALFESLGSFLHRGFKILLLQIADPDEIALPEIGVARFVDIESGDQIQVDPAEIRRTYVKNFEERIAYIADQANRRGMDHQLVNTAEPYNETIEAYLGFRKK